MGDRPVQRAVVLARGLGTRLRRGAAAKGLTAEQRTAVSAGRKAMMPIGSRPFLDHALSRLAAAGLTRVCLVVGPEHGEIRDRYERLALSRLKIDFAEQRQPLGTADAVRAAAPIVGDEPFVVVNGDNLYPVGPLRVLASLSGPGLVAFDPAALVREGNIEADRIRAFAAVEVDEHGHLLRIVEKPSGPIAAGVRVSMNCWRFDARIFAAIDRVRPSPRGELELPAAVRAAIETQGVAFELVCAAEGVLDLTHATDVAALAARLGGEPVLL